MHYLLDAVVIFCFADEWCYGACIPDAFFATICQLLG